MILMMIACVAGSPVPFFRIYTQHESVLIPFLSQQQEDVHSMA